jgi:hypothetical protein
MDDKTPTTELGNYIDGSPTGVSPREMAPHYSLWSGATTRQAGGSQWQCGAFRRYGIDGE